MNEMTSKYSFLFFFCRDAPVVTFVFIPNR